MNTIQNRPLQAVFLIPPNTNLLDFAGACHVFHEAIDHGLDANISFCTYEADIQTSVKLPLGQIDNYDQHQPSAGDIVFIVSADIYYILSGHMSPDKGLCDWIVNAHKAGATICAICNGAFLLGHTGLLNGRKCTTHWKRTDELQRQFPAALVQENILFIEDDRIITSAGATSGIDVALYILGKLRDDHFIYKVSRDLVIYNRRSGSTEQNSVFLNYRNHVHAGIHKVQDWLQDNIDKKANIPELADAALMSERNFTRVFKKETGLTVNEYITLLRKERIKELLKDPDMSRAQIAAACGLQSVKQLSRLMAQ